MRHKIYEHKNGGYKIEKKKNRYHLKELATNQSICDYGYSTEAKEIINKYKLGAGFNGWTPGFMVDSGSRYSNVVIDDEDDQLLEEY
jgi:hypothetical protein|tara:strand:+ start:264 stop:524 length:261 start_codon:yes stop_codon:yes gene_type:complete